MLRRIGVTAISAWAAHGLAWGAGLWMALGPVYQGVSGTPTTPGESATYATRYTATLVEQNGLWVFWLLLVPIMLSALALLTIALTDAGQARRKALFREQGLFVMGVGRSDTPKSFVSACDVFVYTENLSPEEERNAQVAKLVSSDWTELAVRAVEMATQDDGWAFLGAVGNYLRQLDPAFDSRSYGHKQLSLLIKSRSDLFEMRESKSKGGPSVIDVRLN